MEKRIKQFGKIFFLSTGVMASAAMLTGCSEEVAALTGGSGDGAKVEVTASFVEPKQALTRAADGQNSTTGFTLTTESSAQSKVRIYVDNGSGTYGDAFDYSITGVKAITAPATAPTFPSGVNTVKVYGWYPAKSLSGFAVSETQTNDETGNENYCLSDLMVASGTTCTREGSTVTQAANLSFTHVMAKLKVTVNPAANVTVTSVKLKSMATTVSLTETKDGSGAVTGYTGYSVGDATGSSDITLFSGSMTSASDAAIKTCCAVFPAQDKNGTFLEVVASYNGGSATTMTYSFSSAKTFSPNNEYGLTINLDPTMITTDPVSLDAWVSDNNATITVGGGDAPTLSPTELTLTYGGESGTITPTLAGATTFSGVSSNTGIATVSGTSTLTVAPVAAGTCTINVFPTNAKGTFSSAICNVTVNRAAQTVSLDESSLSVYGLSHTKTFTVTRQGNGTITAASSNTTVATTSVNQNTGVVTVTGKAVGNATITVTVAEGTNHLAYTAEDKIVSVSVVAWDRNGADLSTATSNDIGVAVTTDGKLYYNKTAADAAGKTIAGVLAYSGSTGHGLIISLENATNQTWYTINDWSNQTTQGFTGKKLPDAAARGTLASYTTLGSTTVSDWMVLSLDDYTTMWNAFGGATNGIYNATSNGYITDAGGSACSDYYWSTTEFDNGQNAWAFGSSSWYCAGNRKYSSHGVRPVLAF